MTTYFLKDSIFLKKIPINYWPQFMHLHISIYNGAHIHKLQYFINMYSTIIFILNPTPHIRSITSPISQ